jgi:hypothetical protein
MSQISRLSAIIFVLSACFIAISLGILEPLPMRMPGYAGEPVYPRFQQPNQIFSQHYLASPSMQKWLQASHLQTSQALSYALGPLCPNARGGGIRRSRK